MAAKALEFFGLHNPPQQVFTIHAWMDIYNILHQAAIAGQQASRIFIEDANPESNISPPTCSCRRLATTPCRCGPAQAHRRRCRRCGSGPAKPRTLPWRSSRLPNTPRCDRHFECTEAMHMCTLSIEPQNVRYRSHYCAHLHVRLTFGRGARARSLHWPTLNRAKMGLNLRILIWPSRALVATYWQHRPGHMR